MVYQRIFSNKIYTSGLNKVSNKIFFTNFVENEIILFIDDSEIRSFMFSSSCVFP